MHYVLHLQIWAQWVQKIKAKARKLRDQTQGTGGGPALIRPLNETELRVLEITGAAAVDGFASLEIPLVPQQPPAPAVAPQLSSPALSPIAELEISFDPVPAPGPIHEASPSPAHPAPGASRPSAARPAPGTSRPSPARPAPGTSRPSPARPSSVGPLAPARPSAPSTSGQQRPPRANPLLRPDRAYLRPRRQRQPRPPRAQPAQIVSETMTRNNELFRAAIGDAAETIAAAIRQAGADVAGAIRSLGVPGEPEYLDGTLEGDM
ncbi:hypothetical protein O0L34_g5126 [Tuta absoluta]|nr:hypothetical protein O0L34_g5126 [Tuta absoluta]